MKKLITLTFLFALMLTSLSMNHNVEATNDFSTNDTYLTNKGEYSYKHVFQNYNLFLDGNGGTGHLNGPAIVGGFLGKVTLADDRSDFESNNHPSLNDDLLSFLDSDYIEPASSYIRGRANVSGLRLHRNLYLGNNDFNEIEIVHGDDYHGKLNGSRIELRNKSLIYKTDEYVDFEEAFSKFSKQSKILTNNSKDVVEIDNIRLDSSIAHEKALIIKPVLLL